MKVQSGQYKRRCKITLQTGDIPRRHRRFAFIFPLLVLSLLITGSVYSQNMGPKTAVVLEIKGAIGPAVSDYFQRTLTKARIDKAGLVILQMDTPGGLDYSMRHIIKNILSSPIPVVTYVAPGGSRAASAGTYILYASHVAAMAPTTNLGAATPIRVGGLPGMEKEPGGAEEKGKEKKEVAEDALERKMVNDAVAYITALAHRHGRNAEWAEKAVREAVSLTAEEALEMGVIDVMASSMEDLLEQVDGRTVVMEGGEKVTLSTVGLAIDRSPPDWRTKILAVITDPNIAYLLMILGIYGLIYELANPGFVFPGVVGGICLLLALYTFHILPINYAGLALIMLGIVFMTAEAFVPSFGALGIGGIVSFVVGSIILMDEEGMRVSLILIGSIALVSLAFVLWVMGRILTISRKKVRTGMEVMVGSTGEAMHDFREEGRVWILGESWRAESSAPVRKGQKVRVVAQDGLLLRIEIIEEGTP